MTATITVNLGLLDHNLQQLQKLAPKSALMPVIKANAYGHGAIALALHLQQANFSYVAVANVYEALELKNAGYNNPIIVLGAIEPSEILVGLSSGITMSVTSVAALQKLTEYPTSCPGKLHIKLDTGMNRAGISSEQFVDFLHQLKDVLLLKPLLEVEAVYSHLVSAEDENAAINYQQIRLLQEMVSISQQVLDQPLKSHLQNSAGIINFKDLNLDWIRPGLSIYGINPVPNVNIDLRPILTWTAPIGYIRRLTKGQSVSYMRSGLLTKDSYVATVIAGYADGLDRRLSGGKLQAIIGDKKCPVLGNICMDMTMFDLDQYNVNLPSNAILIGSQANQQITVDEIAKTAGTIPNEVLTSLSVRNKRVYI